MSQFYKYFKENMEALGLPAPENLYGNLQLAINTAMTLVGYVEKFGTKVTVREMIGAGIRGEKLLTVWTMGASYYVGAVIGSIAVAAGRSLAGGTSLADVLIRAQMNHLHRPWLPGVLLRHPEIYKRRNK
ncbi:MULTISPECIES: hypothetical protein [unclassified Duganella]|jgi:hypothetical protein|uniref:hypothetical protein n=1 Tax=unclassified Duganella TaxID=2636909 RepID=UPI000881E906|nr:MULTISPECIES: hypothetical protein [unclassified Duganella]SDG13781.1 hypothetical protein SAMN05216320_10317 [Duganella sp. OV458]SDJ34374.1 hypothetical protein SAMN05428973_103471 [Duganella sp. OV510]